MVIITRGAHGAKIKKSSALYAANPLYNSGNAATGEVKYTASPNFDPTAKRQRRRLLNNVDLSIYTLNIVY